MPHFQHYLVLSNYSELILSNSLLYANSYCCGNVNCTWYIVRFVLFSSWNAMVSYTILRGVILLNYIPSWFIRCCCSYRVWIMCNGKVKSEGQYCWKFLEEFGIRNIFTKHLFWEIQILMWYCSMSAAAMDDYDIGICVMNIPLHLYWTYPIHLHKLCHTV
jgi:hypothetical protein